jgi:transposase-like protein
MSPKKITDTDKLEITRLYRQSGDTTASLAIRYGVSNSTISRLLKTSIPETEYEILIQQKRVVKVDVEAETLVMTAESLSVVPTAISSESAISDSQQERLRQQIEQPLSPDPDLPLPSESVSTEEDTTASRRLRRRSSAPISADNAIPVIVETLTDVDQPIAIAPVEIIDLATNLSEQPLPQPVSRTPVLREILADSENRYFTPVVPEASTEDDDDDDGNTEDVNVLAAMFGEEVADNEDDEEFTEEDDDDDDESTSSYQQLNPHKLLTEDRLHVQITPLSQATLPRTCYIVIDKFAELIIRPLKDFADLGQISEEEIQQRTLPVFDNHRVAKRFSNQRTQRVIKVPDSRVFQKTTQHLKLKGITRLLVDGNIYSLN